MARDLGRRRRFDAAVDVEPASEGIGEHVRMAYLVVIFASFSLLFPDLD